MKAGEMNSSLGYLIEWYCAQCNGDWEHYHGIRIKTIDNPGFLVEVDLRGTKLEDVTYQSTEWESGANCDEEWFNCYKSDEKVWIGACSPRLLERILKLFIEWSSVGNRSRFTT